MTEPSLSLWQRLRKGRVRILWLVLGALLLVSALPIGLYHRQVLQLSQDKLGDNERVQQSDLTRSLAQEIHENAFYAVLDAHKVQSVDKIPSFEVLKAVVVDLQNAAHQSAA